MRPLPSPASRVTLTAWTVLQSVADDEVSVDDLLAGIRTTAELNAMIREGLAAARRGEAVPWRSAAWYADGGGTATEET